MPTWITPTLLKYVGIVVTTLTLLLGAYIKGRNDVQIKFSAYKLEVSNAAKAQEEKNQQIQVERELFNKGVIDGYKAKLAAANSYINSLQYDPSSGKLSSASGTASGTNGSSQDDIPPTPILASDCAATTVQLLQLQQWAKGQVDIK
jgi:hypothetical protein